MDHSPTQPPSALTFFEDEETEAHFAALDVALRSGQHAQRGHPQQRPWFGLLQRQQMSFRLYYRRYFGLELEQRQQRGETYYYLRPAEGGGCKAPAASLLKLEPAHVIVALLLCKIVLIDDQEFSSVDTLFASLQAEYNPYREGLFRQLAHLKGNQESNYDEEKVRRWVRQSLGYFEKLGWVCQLPNEAWRVMTSLDRIRELYQDEIQNMATRYNPPHA